MRQLSGYMLTAGLFFAVSLTWGTTWMAMKLALVSFPPVFATGLRFLIAAPMLVALTLRANKPLLFPKGKRKFQVLLALFSFSIPFTLMIYGEKTVSSGMAALLFSVMPVAVVITSWMFLGHTITRIQAMGVIIVMVALGMITLTESGTTEIESGKGVVAILMAVSLHAVVYVLCRKHCAGISVLTYNALPCFGAAVLLLGCSFWSEHIRTLNITSTSIYAVVYLGGVAASHYTQVSDTICRAWRAPSTKIATSCKPNQSVLAPGSPSPFRPRKPPRRAISRITWFSLGMLLGIGFLFSMKAARHSSGSNNNSASSSGRLRPSRIRRLMRHAIIM